MTKVKICGITNLEDARLSVKFGADALGFNFYPKSPRYITPEIARKIIEQLPKEILKVGVFVNESLEKIAEIAETAKLDALQLHGEETPEFAKELKAKTGLEIIKAFRVSPEFKPGDVLKYEVEAILLDAYNPKEHGGTGETFDWEIAKRMQEIFPKMYLAGGLTHENIVTAIRNIKPFFVDVCSGVESKKGKKDKVKLINFIKSVKNENKVKVFYNLKEQKIRNIYDLLDAIQPRPALFFGKKSIVRLNAFLNGYFFASKDFEIDFDWKKFHSISFQNYIAKHFDWDESTVGWANIILEECNNDEEKAFDLFFALLEEFKLEKESDLDN
jgi:phosphoribosylanthranilate isomerase